MKIADQMYKLAKDLWPINRSITGYGVRESLSILKDHLPNLEIKSVKSGTKVYDWNVPLEWNPIEAYIISPDGKKICDFSENNLYLLGYSVSIDEKVKLEELKRHLYTIPEQPNVIPYTTSYYEERWGFCLSHNDYLNLKDGVYHVYINAPHFKGVLNYGELIIPGKTSNEIFLSTYICHPSLANNELSGPVVTTFLAKWLETLKTNRYTYRIIFIPETIGSITYLSKNIETMKENIKAGFNISCVGDDRSYSYIPSRNGNTIADAAALHILTHYTTSFKEYTWENRGSDERQYCAPGVDLPVCSVIRTKYGEYPEYHTSDDKLGSVVTRSGLEGGYNILQKCISCLEINVFYKMKILCEPQLGKRGLYPTLSTKNRDYSIKLMMNFLSWCDGQNSLLDIANRLERPIFEIHDIAKKMKKNNIIKVV
jgi:aminopeptidase-like protein